MIGSPRGLDSTRQIVVFFAAALNILAILVITWLALCVMLVRPAGEALALHAAILAVGVGIASLGISVIPMVRDIIGETGATEMTHGSGQLLCSACWLIVSGLFFLGAYELEDSPTFVISTLCHYVSDMAKPEAMDKALTVADMKFVAQIFLRVMAIPGLALGILLFMLGMTRMLLVSTKYFFSSP
jgi:hypothetical protein